MNSDQGLVASHFFHCFDLLNELDSMFVVELIDLIERDLANLAQLNALLRSVLTRDGHQHTSLIELLRRNIREGDRQGMSCIGKQIVLIAQFFHVNRFFFSIWKEFDLDSQLYEVNVRWN